MTGGCTASLRVAFLSGSQIWEARCSRGGGGYGPSLARQVAKAVDDTVASSIRRDWLRRRGGTTGSRAGSVRIGEGCRLLAHEPLSQLLAEACCVS